MKKKLREIFNHYNKKYKLNYTFIINKFPMNKGGGVCKHSDKIIEINCKEAIEIYRTNNYLHKITKKIKTNLLTVFTLLHELHHAIEGSKNKKEFIKKYFAFNGNYHKNPLEIEADNFAERELKKWI